MKKFNSMFRLLVFGFSLVVAVIITTTTGLAVQEQEKGWCCLQGKVIPATIQECKEKGGNFFTGKEEAEKNCGKEMCWCCIGGKVSYIKS
ncbi:MAG TPA: hypothetical protein VK186_10910, partial [Candidatus Deferrimicrobium sp.]|nr:hypothetical protein [Candidatus Deferrimicrobium sp.]